MHATETTVEREAQRDFLPLNGTDYLEFYVGNAKQAAYYYRAAFGMKLTAYRGPETGTRDRASYVLQQNKIRFVLTAALRPDHPIVAGVPAEFELPHTEMYDEPFHVRVETEWLICSDPMDPGGTEIWSDSIKEDESGSFGTAAEAEGAARNTAIERLKDAASRTSDGLPSCERSDT